MGVTTYARLFFLLRLYMQIDLANIDQRYDVNKLLTRSS